MGQAHHNSQVYRNGQANQTSRPLNAGPAGAIGESPVSTTPVSAPPCATTPINKVSTLTSARPISPLRERLRRGAVTIAGKNGHPHLARPIDATDAGALIRCYDAMTDRGRWFRMLHHLPHLSEDMARDFCTPDPERDLCIVLEGDGPLEGEILGGARITGDKDGRCAEYSVTLRPEAEGLGLAHKALELVFEAAREMGYTHIWGAIHAENGSMLQLAESLDLNLRRDPNDAALMVSEGEL
jgi:RimJ/RimL family protein N-acetyltransferase